MTGKELNVPRLYRISIAILISLILAVTFAYLKDESQVGMLTRGDFPGFYVQSLIYNQDQMQALYDPKLQQEIENRIWPSFKGGYYMSVYPPYDAILLSPLSKFPRRLLK